MNEPRSDEVDDRSMPGDRSASPDQPVPDVADDERASREQIARTGEPKRDALGNGDGAS